MLLHFHIGDGSGPYDARPGDAFLLLDREFVSTEETVSYIEAAGLVPNAPREGKYGLSMHDTPGYIPPEFEGRLLSVAEFNRFLDRTAH